MEDELDELVVASIAVAMPNSSVMLVRREDYAAEVDSARRLAEFGITQIVFSDPLLMRWWQDAARSRL
jgi:hypothetical protein